MIDDGELDWKIIAISTADPLADKLNDVEDVERCARGAEPRAAAQCPQAPSRARLHVGCSKLTGSPSSRRAGHVRRTRPEPSSLDPPIAPPFATQLERSREFQLHERFSDGHTCMLHGRGVCSPVPDHTCPHRTHRQKKSDLMRRRAALRQCTNCHTATARRETDRPGRHLRPASL